MNTLLTQRDPAPISTQEEFYELRSEIAQLTHTLHGYSVDMQLLEEKVSNLSMKKRELLSESSEQMQQKIDQLESVVANLKINLEQSKKQHQFLTDGQLQRLSSLENKVSQHETSLHMIKDVKHMLGTLKENSQTYVVSNGDTLEGISRKFGVKITDLKTANQLISDQIQVGQTLKIPL